jgi:hypothetical protein
MLLGVQKAIPSFQIGIYQPYLKWAQSISVKLLLARYWVAMLRRMYQEKEFKVSAQGANLWTLGIKRAVCFLKS